MSARGGILREAPRDNRTVIKVPRTDILESPLANSSPLKVDVKRRLDEIAADSRAHIAVLSIESPGGGVGGVILATADGQGSNISSSSEPEASTADQPKGVEGGASLNSLAGEGEPPTSTQTGSSEAPATASSVPVSYGLETERMCELVMTGNLESVEIAKVRLLVMLDELVSCGFCHL